MAIKKKCLAKFTPEDMDRMFYCDDEDRYHAGDHHYEEKLISFRAREPDAAKMVITWTNSRPKKSAVKP